MWNSVIFIYHAQQSNQSEMYSLRNMAEGSLKISFGKHT